MTRLWVGWLAVAVISGCLLIAGAAAGERHRVPGTHVTIEPPAGFTPAAQFPGFLRADIGASVMVTELPGPVAEVREGMTKEGLAARGMVLLESQAVQVDGREALLLHIRQEASVWVFEKKSDLDRFINSGWELGAQTTASAKVSGQGANVLTGALSVSPGVWLYQLTDDGLALELTAKGTKYYKDADLN